MSELALIKSHLEELIARNEGHIVQDISDEELEYYDAETGVAHIREIIESSVVYWDMLHEIGHLELGHKVPSNWDEEARMEIEAWEYVKENSVIPIPRSEIKRWEEDRIKGSWE